MSRRISAAAVAVVVVVAVSAVAASGFGSAKPARHVTDAGSWTPTHHAVAASAAPKGVKFTYVLGTKDVAPGANFTAPLACPKSYPHPIGGLFDSNSAKVFLATSRPNPAGATAAKANAWEVGVTNMDTVPATVVAGAVCVQ